MTELVKVERWKKVKYTVNVPTLSGANRKWEWQAPRANTPTVVAMPREAYEWIASNTYAFDKGELRVSPTQPNKEEVEEIIVDKDGYKHNGQSRDEIIELLKKGNLNKIKKEISLITEKSAKQYFYEVFNEVKGELVGSKNEIIEEWYKADSKVKE